MAAFPTELPSFTAKSTENDVSGSILRINGEDINSITSEIVAVAAKVGADDSSDTDSLDYRIAQRETGKRVMTGSGTASAGTSTTVTDANCTAGAKVFIMATDANFAALTGVYISDVSAGQFTVTHSTAAGTETFAYMIVKD